MNAILLNTEYSFLDSLVTMGMGMGGILAVCGLIILTVVILNKVTAPNNKEKDGDET